MQQITISYIIASSTTAWKPSLWHLFQRCQFGSNWKVVTWI